MRHLTRDYGAHWVDGEMLRKKLSIISVAVESKTLVVMYGLTKGEQLDDKE